MTTSYRPGYMYNLPINTSRSPYDSAAVCRFYTVSTMPDDVRKKTTYVCWICTATASYLHQAKIEGTTSRPGRRSRKSAISNTRCTMHHQRVPRSCRLVGIVVSRQLCRRGDNDRRDSTLYVSRVHLGADLTRARRTKHNLAQPEEEIIAKLTQRV